MHFFENFFSPFFMGVLWLSSLTAFSQNLSTVTGRVTGDDNLPIDAGNAVLLSSADSSLVQG
ncbi:MAG: hypothetical protein AAF223_10460, partial [Bacteroidota bacterium]